MMILQRLVLIFLILAVGTAAEASLVGDAISAELLRNGGNFDGPNLHIVGTGPEGNWFNQIEYDLDSATITVRSLFDFEDGRIWVDDMAFSFTSLDWLPTPGRITGATVVDAVGEGWDQIDDGDLSFSDNSLLIDVADIGSARVTIAPQSVTVRLITTHIPEPTTLILAGLAIVASVCCRRRQ